MLAKTEAGEQVTETTDRLGGSTPVLALVESALGIDEAVSIARARGAFRLAFGSGDYRRDTGTSADRSEEHTSALQSRQYLVCRLLLDKKTYISYAPLLLYQHNIDT